MTEKDKELNKEAQVLEEAIAEEIENIQEKLWFKLKVGFSIALIGLGTFWVVKKWLDYPLRFQDFFPPSPSSETENQNFTKQTAENNIPQQTHQELDIVTMIKKEIAMFLLAIAKQKIYELLEKLTNYENEPANEDE